MERKYEVGAAIVFVDSYSGEHPALVTRWFGVRDDGKLADGVVVPCLNLVFVSGDRAKEDSYGRQMERFTSVVHQSVQAAHGMFWRWPDET